MDGDLRITRSRYGPALVLRMQGVLSVNSASALVEALGQLLDQPALLIDLRAVTDLDELGFAAMSEYLSGAAHHGPAFAFLTEQDSCVHEAVERLRDEARHPGMGQTSLGHVPGQRRHDARLHRGLQPP